MPLEFRFLIEAWISISRSGLEQDVYGETDVTNGVLMLQISLLCGCLVPVSFPSSRCHEEEQRRWGPSPSPPPGVSLSYQTGGSPVPRALSAGHEEFCWHGGAAGRWVFLALLRVKRWSVLFSVASGLRCCSQRYLEASGPRCQGKKGQKGTGKNNPDFTRVSGYVFGRAEFLNLCEETLFPLPQSLLQLVRFVSRAGPSLFLASLLSWEPSPSTRCFLGRPPEAAA